MELHHSYKGNQYTSTPVMCEGRPQWKALRATDCDRRVDLAQYKRCKRCTFKVLVHNPIRYAYLSVTREGDMWLHKGVNLAHKDIQVFGVWVWE